MRRCDYRSIATGSSPASTASSPRGHYVPLMDSQHLWGARKRQCLHCQSDDAHAYNGGRFPADLARWRETLKNWSQQHFFFVISISNLSARCALPTAAANDRVRGTHVGVASPPSWENILMATASRYSRLAPRKLMASPSSPRELSLFLSLRTLPASPSTRPLRRAAAPLHSAVLPSAHFRARSRALYVHPKYFGGNVPGRASVSCAEGAPVWGWGRVSCLRACASCSALTK